MVTAIHVVVTLEQTHAPHPTPPHTPSSAPSAASLRACQGHGAVSYYKRSSPSLLQETQTHRSRVPRPRSTAALITHSRPFSFFFFFKGGGGADGETRTDAPTRSGQAQSGKTLNFIASFFKVPDTDVCTPTGTRAL